jgi:2'-5' RNA ligase
MALLVLAYPEISQRDYERIQNFRKDNDVYYSVVDPHFTLVFPFEADWSIATFVEEISKQSSGMQPFDFCIRCTVLNRDSFIDLYHTFLVPDEGYSKFVKLHDQLSAGSLFPYRELSVDFVPHIGIGNSQDPLRCLEMVREWNQAEFTIPGRITTLDIVIYENNKVHTISRVSLGGVRN